MKKLPVASRKIESEAKKRFSYKIVTPEEFAVHGRALFDALKEYLEYEYRDEKFNSWMKRLRSCLGAPKKISKLYGEYAGESERDEFAQPDWFVDVTILQREFEPQRVPRELSMLAEYQNSKCCYISSFFVTHDGAEFLRNWPGSEWKKKTLVFGGFVDGARYAYWLNGDLLSSAPIIYLSHGEAKIVASNFTQFLQLVAAGDCYVGLYEAAEGEEAASRALLERLGQPKETIYDEKKELKKFRSWLQSELGIGSAEEPAKIVSDAREAYPDFDKLYGLSSG